MTKRLSREVVIERAATLSDTIGLYELTITKLSRALEISQPGVYRHVTDMADLRRGIARLAAREVSKVLANACAGFAGRDALSALARALREWASGHPGRYEALQIAPDPDDPEGAEAAEELISVIVGTLRAYRLGDENLIDAVRFLRSTLHGFIALELNGGFKNPRDLEASFTRLISGLDLVLSEWST